jgi:hypothetical protein
LYPSAMATVRNVRKRPKRPLRTWVSVSETSGVSIDTGHSDAPRTASVGTRPGRSGRM